MVTIPSVISWLRAAHAIAAHAADSGMKVFLETIGEVFFNYKCVSGKGSGQTQAVPGGQLKMRTGYAPQREAFRLA